MVTSWINAGNRIEDFVFDDRLGMLKNRCCQWISTVYHSITAHDIISSFVRCGISSSLNEIESGSPVESSTDDDGSDDNEVSDLDHNHNH